MKVMIRYSNIIQRGKLARCSMNAVYNLLSWFNESFVKCLCCISNPQKKFSHYAV